MRSIPARCPRQRVTPPAAPPVERPPVTPDVVKWAKAELKLPAWLFGAIYDFNLEQAQHAQAILADLVRGAEAGA